MRLFQSTLLTLVFGGLVVVGSELWHLDTIARARAAVVPCVVSLAPAPLETPAARAQRVQQQQRDLEADLSAILATPRASRSPERR
jgi:hypothetical protein